ncbi:hypothetical protein FRC15_003424 [Serendipita sp. 397]|nr:hypothetical protein FRC15_003424 [Serendipita sp. 397]KAG8780717.1 hypothetical protein FRC16_003052 [Serendipita sp. 398]
MDGLIRNGTSTSSHHSTSSNGGGAGHSPQQYSMSAPRPPSTLVDYPMHDSTENNELIVLPPPRHPGANAGVVRPPSATSAPRKRKKTIEGDSEVIRRLRRSHEACTRCRLKKIKCDSGHPSCGACAAVGVTCQQEDRHRNKFQPRAHQEIIEYQLIQTIAIIRKWIPDYDPDRAVYFAQREGVSLPDPPPSLPTSSSTMGSMTPAMSPTHMSIARGMNSHSQNSSHSTPAPLMAMNHNLYSPSQSGSDSFPVRSPVETQLLSPTSPPTPYFRSYPFGSNSLAAHAHHPASAPTPRYEDNAGVPNQSHVRRDLEADNGQKGLDPRGRSMANPTAIARGFGVTSRLLEDPRYNEKEPLKVEGDELAPVTTGPSSLHPRLWHSRPFKRGALPSPSFSTSEMNTVWLPSNHKIANHMVEKYFERLNFHRPIFEKGNFLRRFELLYSTDAVTTDDVGFICSTYLILALATLSELHQPEQDADWVSELKAEWPTHEELFSRALVVKPELRVTISSLQALLLLQWYLYSERHGRSLWRLVGTLVRLAIELGLHHDPFVQKGTFTTEECTLRVNLWHSVMIHDRGTSVLLGRPYGVDEEFFNTSSPVEIPGSVSRHFVDSAPLNSVAADIIRSLYRPQTQSVQEVINHAKRILIKMAQFRRTLPKDYWPYFQGTVGWGEEEKKLLRRELTTEKGLTFLKYNIQRLLLLRAMFNNDGMTYDYRIKALEDALKTSHNIIIMHATLTKIPDIGFFVSPLPLHIAAMTIIYGQSCGFLTLPYETGYEDVHSALHITPALRWQWERKDANGGVHPITPALAAKVFKSKPRADKPRLIPEFLTEEDWEDENNLTRASLQDAHLQTWPAPLWQPGPVWPEGHHLHQKQHAMMMHGEGSNSSKSASPIGQHANPQPLSSAVANGVAVHNTGSSSGTGGAATVAATAGPSNNNATASTSTATATAGAAGTAGTSGPTANGPIPGPSMPGNAKTSYFKREEPDLTGLFADVPHYMFGNPIMAQPEPEIQEFFMQEERDPTARPQYSRHPYLNMKTVESFQHMGYSASMFHPYASSSSHHQHQGQGS